MEKSGFFDHQNCTIVTDALQMLQWIEMGIGLVLNSVTVILIICHPTLRKQHHIFPCNIALADLLRIVMLITEDVVFRIGITARDEVILLSNS